MSLPMQQMLRDAERMQALLDNGTETFVGPAAELIGDLACHVQALVCEVVADAAAIHVDGVRNGRRFGEWRTIKTYELVADAPPQEVLRDTAKWQEWCLARVRDEEKGEKLNVRKVQSCFNLSTARPTTA